MGSSNSSKTNQTYTDYDYDVYQYYENLKNLMTVISQVFYYLTLILGVPGNAFVMYVAGFKMKRTVNTVGFLNLAIADLLCCLSTIFYMTESTFNDDWPFGSIMCKIFYFIMHITMFASVFILNLISLDRFAQVVTPVWAQNHRSLFIARLSCAATWILASILSLPFMMSRESFTEMNETYCLDFNEGHYEMYGTLCIIRFVFGFLVPLICITTCYGFIAHKLRRSHFHSGRVFRILSAVIVAFFLCWLPYHIVYLIKMYGEPSSYMYLAALAVDPLAVSLAYFNSCLNPVLYVFMGQDFKSNIKLRQIFERVFSEEGIQASQPT